MKKIASLIIGIVLIATMVSPAFAETLPMTIAQKRAYLSSICGLPSEFLASSADDIIEDIYQEATTNYVELASYTKKMDLIVIQKA
ncbi:MAG: hypothetical protein VB023_02355 [Oscillibacter sp.]|nr:hypothetical protein [Oscillibacter sp.]